MKVSLNWLKEYVSIEMDIDKLADALTMVGLEVEGVSNRYSYLDPVVTGRILDIKPHPNSTDLHICRVDAGKRFVSVVCGAPNVKTGLIVPLAFPGTRFPEGSTLQPKVIYGVASEGMLCSEADLALGLDDTGIMILDNTPPVGAGLAKVLNLSDTIIDINLTPNRSDCLSMLGIAREIAALQNTQIRYPDISLPEAKGNISEKTSVTVDAPDHCPRYGARLIEDITVAPSPFWLQDRLMSIGLRPINNVVDITNYIMMETGQPLHAFDFDRLSHLRIVVRLAISGESFITLDQKIHDLTDEMLMICDGEKPVALAGIMGGLNSEIEKDTKHVLIESACFNPITIRKASKKLGITSEASHRFERGVDPNVTITALNRAAQLLVNITKGKLIQGTIDQYPKPVSSLRIQLSTAKTNRLLGTHLHQDEIRNVLKSIEFEVNSLDNDTLEVIPPTFRVDIDRPVDLMEEVARLWGYNNISTTYPLIPAKAKPVNRHLHLRNRMKNILCGLGFSEIITYSFIDPRSFNRLRIEPDDPLRNTVMILNPLSETQGVMRTSLIPGLLDTASRNIAQQVKTLKLFEIGHIFIQTQKDHQPQEVEMMAGIWTGARDDICWTGPQTDCDYYDIKGSVEKLFEWLGIDFVTFTRMPEEQCRYMTYGHTALIQVNNESMGRIGKIHSTVLDAYDLKQPAFIFEINLNRLMDYIPNQKQIKSVSIYPAISRDVTLIIDKHIESQAIIDHIRAHNEALIENQFLFDVYEGGSIPSLKKSLSFRITYRAYDETLEDDKVNQIHANLTKKLLSAFDATFPT